MRRSLPLLIIVGLIAVLLFWGCGSYNGLVSGDEEVKSSWAKVQSEYQRRADLIPNFVNTVKGAANFEKETFTQVAMARAGQLKQAVNVPVDSLTPARIQQIQQANEASANASRLAINVVMERYPELKATQSFQDLQAELAGTENRVKTARNDYTDHVKVWNTKVRQFPASLFANAFNFKARPTFEAEAGSNKAPKVEF